MVSGSWQLHELLISNPDFGNLKFEVFTWMAPNYDEGVEPLEKAGQVEEIPRDCYMVVSIVWGGPFCGYD